MTFLVPLMLFGWPLLAIRFFCRLQPHRAVLVVVIGGVLFLPQAGYDLQGLPPYTKQMAIALGLILGGRLSGARRMVSFRFTKYDVPMLVWCFCPLASSFSNGLGLYDGLSSATTQCITWGVPYYSGRMYFQDMKSIKDCCLGLIIGGMLYMPLCLYEVRMSPQLSKKLYGFFPGSWRQHSRGGGFRPIVFMQHGLMVSLWMALSSVVTFWLWKGKQLLHIRNIPISVVFIALAVTCVLCKSMNSLFAIIVGCSLYYAGGQSNKKSIVVTLLMLSIPLYILLRTNGIVTMDDLADVVSRFISEKRLDSLLYRLRAEELFFQKAMEHPWFGWGGYSRGKPIDFETGKTIGIAIDSLWLVAMRSRGFVGLVSLYLGMLIGPWVVLKRLRQTSATIGDNLYLIVLSLVVVLFMVDTLLNGMVNSIYVLLAGVLLTNGLYSQPEQ